MKRTADIRFDLRCERQRAAVGARRHLATDRGELAGGERSGCRWKQLTILDADVLLVDRLERREVRAKRTGCRSG